MQTEKDYRVTDEVSKLMKQSGYKGQSFAYYNYKGEYFTCAYSYTNNVLEITEAPFISIALSWAESLRYSRMRVGDANEFILWNKNKPLVEYKFKADLKDLDMAYLTAVCNHIITNKTNK